MSDPRKPPRYWQDSVLIIVLFLVYLLICYRADVKKESGLAAR